VNAPFRELLALNLLAKLEKQRDQRSGAFSRFHRYGYYLHGWLRESQNYELPSLPTLLEKGKKLSLGWVGIS
jgi:hypothetical protein